MVTLLLSIIPYGFSEPAENTAAHGEAVSETTDSGEKPFYRPVIYSPLLIIDCGPKGAHSQDCFKAVYYSTRDMLKSGKFTNVMSLANFNYLYSSGAKTYPETMSNIFFNAGRSKRGRRLQQQLEYLYKHYPAEYGFLVNSKNRYAMIWGNMAKENDSISKTEQSEWTEYARGKKLKTLYYDDPGFDSITAKYFYYPAGCIEIYAPRTWTLWDIQRINRALYKIHGLKKIYSAWHTARSLMKSFPGADGKYDPFGLGKIWELSGEYGSTYWNRGENVFYIQYFSNAPSNSMSAKVVETLKSHLPKDAQWNVYDSQYRRVGGQNRKKVAPVNQ